MTTCRTSLSGSSPEQRPSLMDARVVDQGEFRARATALLLANEAQNNIMLGHAAARVASPTVTYVLVEDAGEVVGAAVHSPPHPMLVTASPSPVLEAIARCVAHVPISAVSCTTDAAERFARCWQQLTGAQVRLFRPMRIFQLDAVSEVPATSGSFGLATHDDLDTAAGFIRAFQQEASVAPSDARAYALAAISTQRLFFWRDPLPVACAAWAGPTPNGVRVNAVYTPPALRGRGYATSCVAALSAHLLASGRRFCFLYTDLSNATSNRIYPRIGYRPVCDTAEWHFTRPGS